MRYGNEMTHPPRRGRPPKAAEDRRSQTIKVQVTDAVKQALERLARAEGVSLSRAISLSLERYRQSSSLFGDSPEIQMFGRLMSSAFALGGMMAGATKQGHKRGDPQDPGQWLQDPYAYELACREVIRALARYRPAGPSIGPTEELLDDQQREAALASLLSFFEKRRIQPDQTNPGRELTRAQSQTPEENFVDAVTHALELHARLKHRQKTSPARFQKALAQYEEMRKDLTARAAKGEDTAKQEAFFKSFEGLLVKSRAGLARNLVLLDRSDKEIADMIRGCEKLLGSLTSADPSERVAAAIAPATLRKLLRKLNAARVNNSLAK